MSNQRAAILELHRQGKRQSDTVHLLGVAQSNVSKAILRLVELGRGGDRTGRGRNCSANTHRIRKIVRKRVTRGSKVSVKKIACDIGTSSSFAHRIARKDFWLKSS
ncbi:unnamed protein product [Nippostrongylus brasiliensis]|uniref:HTH_Tnp_Tc3_1 domain-containing protein n=1 Tax=Nippostrongylus brasiliensis TaxID=27835 RepID=A0A0N4Y203_NIPBR|nr:unnamed protein product [Nippostrongylus brasiliensis]